MHQQVKAKRWESQSQPKRILVIRLQAIGDVIITFPFVQLLKNQYPGAQIDFLTRRTQQDIVRNIAAVDNVIAFTNSHRSWREMPGLVSILPKLILRNYEVILDLQMNRVSTLIRQILAPKAFAEFEKFTPFTAADRTRNALRASGLLEEFDHPQLQLRNNDLGAVALLKENGWDGQKKILILNPAGAFKSRNWPIENYAAFARNWLNNYRNFQFLLLGVDKINEKANFLKSKLGNSLINLVGKTSLNTAFCLVSKADFMLSEDSGLMHMAWALRIPTIALIGSTDKNRSAQNGNHIISLNSDDLSCGNCMKPDCQFGEIPLCISRYSPELIMKIAEELLFENEEKYRDNY